ncbi:hypothetical protein FRB90_003302 [Tulasnella sp. 427]|nr:hypothetical protein FRB90_003302 [Tulasnella sp. 427]
MPPPSTAHLSSIVATGKELASELFKLDVSGDLKDVVDLARIALLSQDDAEAAFDAEEMSNPEVLLDGMDWNAAPAREPTPSFPPQLNTLLSIVSRVRLSQEQAETSALYIQYMCEIRGFTGHHGTAMLLQKGNADVENLAKLRVHVTYRHISSKTMPAKRSGGFKPGSELAWCLLQRPNSGHANNIHEIWVDEPNTLRRHRKEKFDPGCTGVPIDRQFQEDIREIFKYVSTWSPVSCGETHAEGKVPLVNASHVSYILKVFRVQGRFIEYEKKTLSTHNLHPLMLELINEHRSKTPLCSAAQARATGRQEGLNDATKDAIAKLNSLEGFDLSLSDLMPEALALVHEQIVTLGSSRDDEKLDRKLYPNPAESLDFKYRARLSVPLGPLSHLWDAFDAFAHDASGTKLNPMKEYVPSLVIAQDPATKRKEAPSAGKGDEQSDRLAKRLCPGSDDDRSRDKILEEALSDQKIEEILGYCTDPWTTTLVFNAAICAGPAALEKIRFRAFRGMSNAAGHPEASPNPVKPGEEWASAYVKRMDRIAPRL